MAKKKVQPIEPDSDDQELEAKIKKMLDPREPDFDDTTSIEVIKDDDTEDEAVSSDELPTKIEIQDHDSREEPTTAPPLGQKIAVSHDSDESAAASTESDHVEKKEEAIEEPETGTEASARNGEEAVAVSENGVTEATDDVKVACTEATDPELDRAVDEIIAEESDKVLESEDKELAAAFNAEPAKKHGRIRRFFAAWWHSKRARRLTLLVLLLAIVAAGTIPTSRYFVLNAAGVRSSASLRVIDQSSLQPLKNVAVSLNGQTALTDKDGNATVENIKLGKTELKVEKRAFAPISKKVVVGWGSNPFGKEELKPVGTQYSFVVTDYVSGTPLAGVEAVSGEASALSDEKGLIKLTLDMPEDEFKVEISGDDLRKEALTVDADDMNERKVAMVPAKKHAFISKRSGTYDVYAVYADGSDETLVLKGTGSERDDLVLTAHPTRDYVALVSTRDNERNDDGFLLSTLTIIDLNDTDIPKAVVSSERIQVIGWVDERLVFVQIASGTSAANPGRHRLKTYNLNEGTAAELAQSNYFNDVTLAGGTILFAPSGAYAKEPAALHRMQPDGSDKQIVHPAETWSMFRTAYDTLTYTTGRDWFEYSIADKVTKQLEGEPSDVTSRAYIDNAAMTKSLWIDQRDGKGVLIAHDTEKNEEETVHEQSGLKLPVLWLNNTTAVFRIATDEESADYVVSTLGGEPKKLADVTNTAGIDRWYYY